VSFGLVIGSASHRAVARLNCVRAQADGWEAGIRTPITWCRGPCGRPRRTAPRTRSPRHGRTCVGRNGRDSGDSRSRARLPRWMWQKTSSKRLHKAGVPHPWRRVGGGLHSLKDSDVCQARGQPIPLCSQLCSDRVVKRRTGTGRDGIAIERFTAGNREIPRDS
jgi:hypothetical protein